MKNYKKIIQITIIFFLLISNKNIVFGGFEISGNKGGIINIEGKSQKIEKNIKKNKGTNTGEYILQLKKINNAKYSKCSVNPIYQNELIKNQSSFYKKLKLTLLSNENELEDIFIDSVGVSKYTKINKYNKLITDLNKNNKYTKYLEENNINDFLLHYIYFSKINSIQKIIFDKQKMQIENNNLNINLKNILKNIFENKEVIKKIDFNDEEINNIKDNSELLIEKSYVQFLEKKIEEEFVKSIKLCKYSEEKKGEVKNILCGMDTQNGKKIIKNILKYEILLYKLQNFNKNSKNNFNKKIVKKYKKIIKNEFGKNNSTKFKLLSQTSKDIICKNSQSQKKCGELISKKFIKNLNYNISKIRNKNIFNKTNNATYIRNLIKKMEKTYKGFIEKDKFFMNMPDVKTLNITTAQCKNIKSPTIKLNNFIGNIVGNKSLK